MNIFSKSFKGYLRKDGRKGIRNRLLVIYTVECAAFVAKEISRQSPYPETECVGFSGCTDNQYAVRLLISLIRHPNVGGVLTVGLGCEYTQPSWLDEIARNAGKAHAWLLIQTEGGTLPSVRKGLSLIREMLPALSSVPQREMQISDLVIGAECGGSDYTSGLAGNVTVGRFFDMLVDAGGTALFEEIVEAVGLEDYLSGRGAGPSVKKEIRRAYQKALEYCSQVRQYSVSPGNFAGGLSTIEEKSMGAVAKSGARPINGVLKVSENPPSPGLFLLDSTPDPYFMQFGITNPNDSEGLLDLISCGAHLVFLVTGRGNVIGSAVSPCLKITGNADTYRHMKEDMDFDASPVLFGDCTLGKLAEGLAGLVLEIASEKKSRAECLGHAEYFIPYKYQEMRCRSNETY